MRVGIVGRRMVGRNWLGCGQVGVYRDRPWLRRFVATESSGRDNWLRRRRGSRCCGWLDGLVGGKLACLEAPDQPATVDGRCPS